MRHRFARLPLALRLLLLTLLNGVLGLALVAVIWFDNSLNRGITFRPDPQPIPHSAGPLVGVNLYQIHLEPNPDDVTRTLAMVKALGATHVRMQLPWEDVEIHGRGDFEDRRNIETVGVISAWDKYDHIVNTAHELGLELILRIDRPPLWSRPINANTPWFAEGLAEDPNSTGPPDDFADYRRFVEQVTRRYAGKVRYVQLWNEPNLKNEWNWHTPSPRTLVALLREGYIGAKDGNPDVVVIFPALAPVDGLDKRAPITEIDYLDQVYQMGGAEFFDVMAVQAYGLGQPPDENRYIRLLPFGPTWQWQRCIDSRADVSRPVLIREVMERHGDRQTAVWVGEFGWNSAPDTIPPERRLTWGVPVTEEQKAAFLIGHVERARQQWDWVGVMNIWMLRYGGFREPNPDDPTQYFAIISRDWEPLPAFTAMQAYLAQPPVAGVGAHTLEHPAVVQQAGRWTLRFTGERVYVTGAVGQVQAMLDGVPITLEPSTYQGVPALATPPLPRSDAVHTLELPAPLPADTVLVVIAEPPLPYALWRVLWAALPLLVIGMLGLSGAATLPILYAAVAELLGRTPPARMGWRVWLATPNGERVVLVGMALALVFFYKGYTTLIPCLIGLTLFGLLALLRPDLAVLFVPLTVPLFFIPKGIWDERFGLPPNGIRLPLHELALLITLMAVAVRVLLGLRVRVRHDAAAVVRQVRALLTLAQVRAAGQHYAPHLLFLVAGTLGVAVAWSGGRSEAVREWRWLIVEPLLFYALVRWLLHQAQASASLPPTPFGSRLTSVRLLTWLVAGGAVVGLVGVLQWGGINLAPSFGDKVTFSDDQLAVEGVRRVNSVYGHPNNLGLYIGRVWVIGAALVYLAWLARAYWRMALLTLAAAVMLGGLVASFSKGALLGVPFAAVVLVGMLWRTRPQAAGARPVPAALLAALVGAAIVLIPLGLIALASVAGLERLNPFGETAEVRLKLWAAALAMIRDHPLLGIGLDQFGRIYPDYIHPTLAATNERFTAHPHNLVLDVWLRLGVLGMVAMAWLLVRLFRQAWVQRTVVQAGLAAAMVAALVHGMVDNGYFVPDLALFFWLAVAVGEVERNTEIAVRC